MEESIGMSQFRENIRDEMDQVQRGHRYLVERYGKPTAAVIPVELYEQIRDARDSFRELVNSIRESASLTEEEAMDLALEAQESVRSDDSQ